ncbi:hypothetical protein NDU88_006926 [Pleurodeles waltl]|uniref:Uncharacterized protein n=1 Tax=Pleurodeles waltl TaxID=8319 RepID=A0AAV7TZZ9_PLEWA|nr:hypothetical protein NDU88_006926 [Pleurodeles waltl]
MCLPHHPDPPLTSCDILPYPAISDPLTFRQPHQNHPSTRYNQVQRNSETGASQVWQLRMLLQARAPGPCGSGSGSPEYGL